MTITIGLRSGFLRGVMAILATTALTLTAVPAAPPAVAATADRGLFGVADPTYDGVFRQSIAILGLAAGGREVPAAAIAWLLDQQCANGAFQSYRSDPSAPCDPGSATTYSGIDANSTAAAAWALATVGRERAADRSVRWLLRQQGEGGGWAWIRGLATDSFSTSLALIALDARPETGRLQSRAEARDWLRTARLGCTAEQSDRGALSFYADGLDSPDPLSSATALAALARPGGARITPADLSCPTASGTTAQTLAAWLMAEMTRGGGGLPDAYTPGATDWNSTAWALMGLASSGIPRRDLLPSLRAMDAASADYTKDGTVAAALGALLLVGDATDFRFPQTRRLLLATMRA